MTREERVIAAACRAVASLAELASALPPPPAKTGKPSPMDLILRRERGYAELVEQLQAIAKKAGRCAEVASECWEDDFRIDDEWADRAIEALYDAGRVAGELLRRHRRAAPPAAPALATN